MAPTQTIIIIEEHKLNSGRRKKRRRRQETDGSRSPHLVDRFQRVSHKRRRPIAARRRFVSIEAARTNLSTMRGASLAFTCFTLLHLFALYSTFQTNALRVSVSIPELVKLNDAFWLNCSHQKQQPSHLDPSETSYATNERTSANAKTMASSGDDIYAIKWYKDDEEFYRYLPNAQPKVSIYETNGVQLDQAKSAEGDVFVTKADVNSEGTYRCEILSEAPLFETVRKSKHLKVYALPVRGPRIEILDANGRPKSLKAQEISYAVGDKIELRCNSAPSKPAARLRWYLNDHELTIPRSNTSTSGKERARRSSGGAQLTGYDVRVTPIEHRLHYKSIYSSHSTLSLVLQQDNLINNKISFKCLASMRQDVSLKSKQLILLTPQSTLGQAGETSYLQDSSYPHQALARSGRNSEASVQSEPFGDDSEAHVHHRQRPQHQRHSVSRLAHLQNSSRSQQQLQQQQAKLSSDQIGNLPEESLKNQMQMMYIYENSDSTLGSSIIETAESLENYLAAASAARHSMNDSASEANVIYHPGTGNYIPTEFNRADNLEYIQLLRERAARQRSFPAQQSGSYGLKRIHGANTLVKSPLYLEELDTLRPVISWPPLDSGKIMLLPPGHTIVAIPTQSYPSKRSSTLGKQQRFILPSKVDLEVTSGSSRLALLVEDESQLKFLILLEKLLQNLNCTCTDGSIDTKLGWLINDATLEVRGTRLYPTRVSPDHRQTWFTIGLQTLNLWPSSLEGLSSAPDTRSASAPTSIQAVLAQYLKKPTNTPSTTSSRSSTSGGSFRLDPVTGANQQQSVNSNNQIKFTCQATHSMLLYSSSEMITFDFNPPPQTSSFDGNSIDKFASMPSNVIQATSASQSGSSGSRSLQQTTEFSLRSQTFFIACGAALAAIYAISKPMELHYLA